MINDHLEISLMMMIMIMIAAVGRRFKKKKRHGVWTDASSVGTIQQKCLNVV